MFPKSFYLLETCKAGLSKKPRINYDQHDEAKQEARDLIVFFSAKVVLVFFQTVATGSILFIGFGF